MMNVEPATTQGNLSHALRRIADVLLSPRADDDGLRSAAEGLYALCSSVSGIDEDSNHADDARETRLAGGKAISPRDAARCLLDYRRTSKFLRAAHAAVIEARRRFPGAAVEVLYAGCGPFAPLAIPLTTRFGPSEIRFTLLDVHQRSLDAARALFQAFGAAAHARAYVRCDAATYRHAAPHDVHVVMVEAMQAALEGEPQVSITANLAPQLCAGGIFIPERITVDCHLCEPSKGNAIPRAVARLGRAFELTAGEGGAARLPPKLLLDLPQDLEGEFNLMLSTSINLFGPITLEGRESGLTCPRVLHELGKVRGGIRVEVAYHLGDRPGFRYRTL